MPLCVCVWREFCRRGLSDLAHYVEVYTAQKRSVGEWSPPPGPGPHVCPQPAAHITEHFCSAVCLISVKVAWAFSFMASKSMF